MADTTTTTTNTAAFTMKLFIDTRARRVRFAETTRGVVDLLYSLLNSDSDDTGIPFEDETCDGCMDNIAYSVLDLDDLEAEAATGTSRRPPPPPEPLRRRFFVCGRKKRGAAGCAGFVAEKSGAKCPSCGEPMVSETPPGAPGAGCSWQAPPPPPPAQPTMTCTLMDDLSIGPKLGTAIAVVTMKGAKLQEKTVRVGHGECLEILMAALQSSSALTDVFLRGEAPAAGAPS